jgi:hypothetical protein
MIETIGASADNVMVAVGLEEAEVSLEVQVVGWFQPVLHGHI